MVNFYTLATEFSVTTSIAKRIRDYFCFSDWIFSHYFCR